MDRKTQALLGLVVALAAGALAQHVVDADAAFLGLSALELALLVGAVGALAKRTLI